MKSYVRWWCHNKEHEISCILLRVQTQLKSKPSFRHNWRANLENKDWSPIFGFILLSGTIRDCGELVTHLEQVPAIQFRSMCALLLGILVHQNLQSARWIMTTPNTNTSWPAVTHQIQPPDWWWVHYSLFCPFYYSGCNMLACSIHLPNHG